MEQPAPDRILLIARDAIHNLRASLDFTMSDIEFDTTNARDAHISVLYAVPMDRLIRRRSRTDKTSLGVAAPEVD